MFFVLCKMKWYCTIWISFQFNRLIYSNDIQRSESDGLSQWQSPSKLNHWHHLKIPNCTITQPWPLFFFPEQKQKKIKYFNTLQCSKTMIIKCIFNSNWRDGPRKNRVIIIEHGWRKFFDFWFNYSKMKIRYSYY
jgi:hypothetical protein